MILSRLCHSFGLYAIRVFGLNQIYLTLDYDVVSFQKLKFDLSNFLRLISDEQDVDAIDRFRLVRLCSELTKNRDAVQPVGSPDIILVGFEHDSSWLRCLLLNLLGVTPVIGGTKPTYLPKYYLVGVSTVSF